MKTKHKIIVSLIYVLALFVWWNVMFSTNMARTDIIDVGPGNMTFVATMDAVRAIGPSNEKAEDQHYFDGDEFYWLYVEIVDEAGVPAGQLASSDTNIYLNGYTSPENTSFIGLPAGLIQGKKYTVSYSCLNELGEEIGEFSFRLYGETQKVGNILLVPFILIAVIGIIVIWGLERINHKRTMIVTWCLLILLNLLIMPTIATPEENSSFADIYNLSSKLLGAEYTYDENGYVYIQEDEIRNNANSHYLEQLVTYWTSIGVNSGRADNLTSSNYRLTATKGNLFQLPAGMGVALARKLRLPYQLIQAIGWLINGFIVLLILSDAWNMLGNAFNMKAFYAGIIVLPSFVISSMSYTAYGIWMSTLLWMISYLVYKRNTDGFAKKKLIAIVMAVLNIHYLIYKFLNVILEADSKLKIIEATKQLILSADEIINEVIAYDAFDYTKAFLSIFAIYVCIFLLKMSADKEIVRLVDTKTLTVFMTIVIGSSLIMLVASGCHTSYNSGSWTGNMNGFSALAILMVPFVGRRNKAEINGGNVEESELDNASIVQVIVLLSCVATLWKITTL